MKWQDDIERNQYWREQAIKQQTRYQQLLSPPVCRRTGRPLAKGTIKSYRSAMNRCNREIVRYEKEIAYLRELQLKYGEWPRMHGEGSEWHRAGRMSDEETTTLREKTRAAT